MPVTSRPGAYINWVTSGNPSYITQPPSGQQNTGWLAGQPAPFNYENYNLYILDQWTQFLDYITDNGAWLISNTGHNIAIGTTVQSELDELDAYLTYVPPTNFLVNGAFDYWQRLSTSSTSSTSQTYGNSNSQTAGAPYLADQWYVKNSLGTNGVITVSQVAGVQDGSIYGCSVKITTAPTASQANGCELYQVIENPMSISLYDQIASMRVWIKALGNVNQVGLQFYYSTTESKLTTSIGSEVTVNVNSSGFSLGQILGQALGTSMTTSGVVGVRVRILGVSSGNTWDLNNGFVLEQAMVNLGSVPSVVFSRCGRVAQQELAICQRFYEKSWDVGTLVGTIADANVIVITSGGSSNYITVFFKVNKRSPPTVTSYNPSSGASGTFRNITASSNPSATFGSPAGTSIAYANFAATAGDAVKGHWTSEAAI